MADESDVLKIWDKVKDKGEKEVKSAAKDLLKIGRDAFNDFMKDVRDTVTDEDALKIAELYARAETNALQGAASSASRVIARLNLTARAAANVKRSQSIKKSIAIWDSVLKVITSLAGSLASIGSAGLSDLAAAGLDAAKSFAESTVKSATGNKEAKKKSSTKKTSTKKKKNDGDTPPKETSPSDGDEDIVIDDD